MKLSRILVCQSLLACGFAYFQFDQTTLGVAPLNHQSGPFVTHALPSGQPIPQKVAPPPPQGVAPAPLRLRIPSTKAEKPKSEAGAPAPAKEKEEHGEPAESSEEPEGAGGALELSLFLVGGTGALMLIFNLASSCVMEIKVATWRLMNTMTSIFIAVVLYALGKGVIEHAFEPSPSNMVRITLVSFALLFVGLHAVLYNLKGGGNQLKAVAQISAHVCGFCAMFGVADLMLVHEFNFRQTLLVIIVSGVTITGGSWIMHMAMNKVSNADGFMDSEEKEWMETCEETTDDVFCLSTSFLITLMLQYIIRGKHETYIPGEIENVTQTYANKLLAVALLFGVLVGVGAVAMKSVGTSSSTAATRAATNFQHLTSMIMAWCFLFWAEWQMFLFGWGCTTIAASLANAIFMTLLSFACVCFLALFHTYFRRTKMLHRSLKSLELALGVLAGFSWERAFDLALEHITIAGHSNGHGGRFAVTLMAVALLAISFAAWRLYILPKALSLEDESTEDQPKQFDAPAPAMVYAPASAQYSVSRQSSMQVGQAGSLQSAPGDLPVRSQSFQYSNYDNASQGGRSPQVQTGYMPTTLPPGAMASNQGYNVSRQPSYSNQGMISPPVSHQSMQFNMMPQ